MQIQVEMKAIGAEDTVIREGNTSFQPSPVRTIG